MTIRLRLIGLVVITNLFLILSLVYVNIQSSAIEAIREEQVLLNDMQRALNAESSGLMDFLISSFDNSIDEYKKLSNTTTASFERGRENIILLPELGEAVSTALESVFRLNDLMIERRMEHGLSADRFWQAANESFLYVSGVSVFRIVTDDLYRRGDYEKVIAAAADFITTQAILHDTITSNVEVLGRQIEVINTEIRKLSRRQNTVMNIGIIAAIILSVILSSLIIRVIIKRIKSLQNDIEILATGNLTVRAQDDGRDELSELGKNLNDFADKLRNTFATIQSGSQLNTQARNDLLIALEDSVGSVEEGERNVESILVLTTSLDQSVKESEASADLIVNRVESFAEMVQAQVAMVEESTAAITEITASLSNMSKTVGSNREAAIKLEKASSDGSDKIEETGNTIRRVSSHVNAIQEMADVIKGVADQTNLLAMNAAIEAAHAGDAGRGFGVVADEIRKLAETTAENSRVISENLRAIIDDINNATESSTQTISSFELIDSEVKGVINRTAEVAASIEELGQGGGQVMAAMNELQDYTTRVKENTIDISENIHSVRSSVAAASDISHQVNTGSMEIRTGMSIIRESSGRTRNVADSIKAISLDLDSAVRSFITGTGKIEDAAESVSYHPDPDPGIPFISGGEEEYTLSPGTELKLEPEELPLLDSGELAVLSVEEEDGVTLSEGDWPGKDDLVIVDEEGKPDNS
jgi:methyl-accepting chemotaxis protein